jgi:hypothetical protein
MATNGLTTPYDDMGHPIASTLTGKGNALYGALCVSDNGVPMLSTSGGALTAAIAAGASTTAIKAAPGRVCRAVVTTAGTATDNITIYDNASAGSGTILAIIPGGTAVGTVIDIQMPAANGIYAVNVASGPAVTLSYV